jgi:hypothetical protein
LRGSIYKDFTLKEINVLFVPLHASRLNEDLNIVACSGVISGPAKHLQHNALLVRESAAAK